MANGVHADKQNGTYVVAATLVHRTILSIIGGIAIIAGYMVLWAIQDTGWKASTNTMLTEMRRDLEQIEERISADILPIAKERIEHLEEDLKEHKENGH